MSGTREVEGLVRQVHAAHQALRAARLRLSEVAGPAPGLIDPSWDWARRILLSRVARLRESPGVVGYALGTRVRRETPEDEACLTVYVRRKLGEDELRARGWRPLPPKVGTGSRSIGIDVVELGDLERHSAVPMLDASRLAASPQADASGQASSLIERLRAGRFVTVPGLGVLRGSRPPLFPDDAGIAVSMAGLVSGVQRGVLLNPIVHLPGWGLDTALLAQVHSVPGDSGAVLVDAEGLVLGFLVGRATRGRVTPRVFRPAHAFAQAAPP